jgi:hypothetical protein
VDDLRIAHDATWPVPKLLRMKDIENPGYNKSDQWVGKEMLCRLGRKSLAREERTH